MIKPILYVLALLTFFTAYSQPTHPHILVKAQDKAAVLEKIRTQSWAKKSFDTMLKRVSPYVERHKTNPDWILSRYLMNRVPGKRYTQFYSDADGTALVRYAGDAPYPTVRVSPHKRPPIAKDGYRFRTPKIEELVPNDTAMTMRLQSTGPGGEWAVVDPQHTVEVINGSINELALDAAILYWLTDKPEYARFAADILNQWARGASYQNPIEGPCRIGFLSIQTLGDGSYEPIILAYDFLYDFLRQQKYETSYYENVFGKLAHTMAFRGLWNNNWFAAETPVLVFSALSLENKQQRDYYLDFMMRRDTIAGNCGQLALPSAIEKWFTPDGHWKEPGGYHNFPVSSLLISGMALENNGIGVFKQYPALFQASYVMLKYAFPNYTVSAFGDTGRPTQSPECLEIGITMAQKYNSPILPSLIAAMDVVEKNQGYDRSESGYLGLLCFLPKLPEATGSHYRWPRSGELDFAKCYLQRNGTDPKTGLMYVVQGASYNHNHANGMSVELYGAGRVMGIDPGNGASYEDPMHTGYYAQWAAHNTVVADARSSSVPYFRGGGGTKTMGEIKLAAMEPRPEREAVSANCSFTDTRYTDISTKTNQQRTLAIIRTSATTGYYVDIYRSANAKSNEYLYHNVGDDLTFLTANRQPVAVASATLPMANEQKDPPGLRHFSDVKTPENVTQGLIAQFSLTTAEPARPAFMQVHFPAEKDRTFYSVKAPRSGTAEAAYQKKPTPTLVVRQAGEAWAHPFVAVYEPYAGIDAHTVVDVRLMNDSKTDKFTALSVRNKDQSQQLIFQSTDAAEFHEVGDGGFQGHVGVVGLQGSRLLYLYLGSGDRLTYQGYTITATTPMAAANLTLDGKNLRISCNQETQVTLPSGRKATLVTGTKKTALSITATKNGVTFTVPAMQDGVVIVD